MNDYHVLDEISDLQRQVLAYSRVRFLWTWLAMAVLTLMIAVVLFLQARTDNDLEHKTNQIRINQAAVVKSQQTITRLTQNTAAAVCLVALAHEGDEAKLIATFDKTGKIDISDDPGCKLAVKKAVDLILVK